MLGALVSVVATGENNQQHMTRVSGTKDALVCLFDYACLFDNSRGHNMNRLNRLDYV